MPTSASAAGVLAVQRSAGNQAALRFVAAAQAKLELGEPDDPLEADADRVADEVVQALRSSSSQQRTDRRAIEESPLAMRRRHEPTAVGEEGSVVEPQVEQAITSSRGHGRPMPESVRQQMEDALGADLTAVRIHTGPAASVLNRRLEAKAFTVGTDIFFRGSAPDTSTASGQHLLAHELAHTVQQTGATAAPAPPVGLQRSVSDRPVNTVIAKGRTQPSPGHSAPPRREPAGRSGRAALGPHDGSLRVQRLFAVAKTTGKSHLREHGQWDTHKGPDILSGARLLVDTDDSKKVKGKGSSWRPALNVPPDNTSLLADDRRGYIRSTKTKATADPPFETLVKMRVSQLLKSSETVPWLKDKLDTQAHVDFLMEKSIRSAEWVGGEMATFVPALQTLDAKLLRIKDGADYVAKVLIHWKEWLYPERADAVTLEEMRLVKSDLHERGLGVVEVRFKKPAGGSNTQYAGQTDVHAFIKPEDKSLEQNLLGHGPKSAASKINKIAGLKGNEQIRTIKMESTDADEYGTFVEAARGVKTESYFEKFEDKEKGSIQQSFHETLIFAYLAGIDDLHMKNVYFEKPGSGNTPGIPTLIDADVVMGWSQMNKDKKESSGKDPQSGFGQYNRAEAKKSQQAITTQDNSEVNSKILNVMLTNKKKRGLIMKALEEAIAGHKGRVVPIRTNQWGTRLKSYVRWDAPKRDTELTNWSTNSNMVRKGIDFNEETWSDGANRKLNQAIGPGLFGTAGENGGKVFYDAAVEKAETKTDLDMGSVPFYEYEYDTGRVTHNGKHIYNGVTLRQAMDDMVQRFGGV
ncbi:MAG TPA: DUF4157 domain-containing protein [Acidimicrobiales bacterium]